MIDYETFQSRLEYDFLNNTNITLKWMRSHPGQRIIHPILANDGGVRHFEIWYRDNSLCVQMQSSDDGWLMLDMPKTNGSLRKAVAQCIVDIMDNERITEDRRIDIEQTGKTLADLFAEDEG